jgi:hypothetical protein
VIEMNLPRIPMSDRVAGLVGRQLPLPVLQAVADAGEAVADVRRYRLPLFAEDREDALARLAAANKVLAAFNPGLIVTQKAVAA